MRLSELRGRTTGSAGPTVRESGELPGGIINNATTYQRPLNALYQGQPVRLIGFGDITGMSPAEKFVDANGQIDWAPSEEFVVDDPGVVPQSAEQRQRLQQASRPHASAR